MIKVENIDIWGFEHAIHGMRNPKASWDKSDSGYGIDGEDENVYVIGPNDIKLMRSLYSGGPEHRKFMRQIFVSMDITAPLYWWAEFDTYKVGVTRDSCSFMHKGVSKPFQITDFSIHNDGVYSVLCDIKKPEHNLTYPYETDEFRDYVCENGRKYKVFKNGRVVAYPHVVTEANGRQRFFDEHECKPTQNGCGYYYLNTGGRGRERWLLHRLVAFVWLDNPDGLDTVNHIDGNKGNNCVENLEWMKRSDNIKEGFENGLFKNGKSLHAKYLKWKNGHKVVNPHEKAMILAEHRLHGATCKQIANKYGISVKQANNIISGINIGEQELFELCYIWETVIKGLNDLRDDYLEYCDPQIFQQIRCLLPSGYKQTATITMNYENAVNMIRQREFHKLDEWREFVRILKGLPYIAEITGANNG